VRLEESAASTRSPALTSEMGVDSPDSSVTVSEPAKHALPSPEEGGDDVDDGLALTGLVELNLKQ
jgi:hypothetical protein